MINAKRLKFELDGEIYTAPIREVEHMQDKLRKGDVQIEFYSKSRLLKNRSFRFNLNRYSVNKRIFGYLAEAAAVEFLKTAGFQNKTCTSNHKTFTAISENEGVQYWQLEKGEGAIITRYYKNPKRSF